MVTFTVSRKELLVNLKKFKAAKGKRAKEIKIICEITVTNGKITIVLPGMELYLPCKTTGGGAKIAVKYFYFLDIVKGITDTEPEFKVTQGTITVGILTFYCQTWFFPNDRILRSIQLPINYSDKDLLLLRNGRYTDEELEFNKMTFKIEQAEDNLKSNIMSTYNKLKEYGVNYSEIEEMVNNKLK